MSATARTRLDRMASIALIGSGGHTFTVERHVLPGGHAPLELYSVAVPPEEGELRIVRCGLRGDGPFGIEFELNARVALPVDRAMVWVHALHATTRPAEQMNRRPGRRR